MCALSLPLLPPPSIAVITRGKYCVLRAGGLSKLSALLSDDNSEVRLNAIKVGGPLDSHMTAE